MTSHTWTHDLNYLRIKFERFAGKHGDDKHMLNKSFREDWFSDSLAWLLDPRGSHGLGVEPVKEFVKMIARERSDRSLGYKRAASFLKYGKEGFGIPSSGFSLRNVSPIREFHLTRSLGAFPDQGTRFCDLMLMDFDKSDSLIIVIENKINGENHPGQLQGYFQSNEKKFKHRIKCREYVYLTLTGKQPVSFENENIRNWVCLGWIPHMLPILDRMHQDDDTNKLLGLKESLAWIYVLVQQIGEKEIEGLRDAMLEAYGECLTEELNRLTKIGNWHIEANERSLRINHSSHPAKKLKLRIRSAGPSIEVQGLKNTKRIFETMVIPCNLHPSQTKNLIDLYSKDILNSFFTSPQKFMNKNKWTPDKNFGKKQQYDGVFRFVYDFPTASELLFAAI